MRIRYSQKRRMLHRSAFILSFVGILILCLSGIQKAQAQSKFQVKGIVKNAANGAAMPGVNVIVKGTTFGTTTGMDGEYSITVPASECKKDSLVFSYIGNISGTVPINGMETVNVSLPIKTKSALNKKK